MRFDLYFLASIWILAIIGPDFFRFDWFWTVFYYYAAIGFSFLIFLHLTGRKESRLEHSSLIIYYIVSLFICNPIISPLLDNFLLRLDDSKSDILGNLFLIFIIWPWGLASFYFLLYVGGRGKIE